MERRRAAIFVADVVGYSRLTGGGSKALFDFRQHLYGDSVDRAGIFPARCSGFTCTRRMDFEPAFQRFFRRRTGANFKLRPRVAQTVERLGHPGRTFHHRQSRRLGG